MKLAPTLPADRIEGLDFLRGIALLGIFIANMLTFHSPYIYMDPYSWFTAPSDAASFKMIDIFIEASFYPLFAMLFGYGLNMQYEKARAAGAPFAPFMARRMGILMLFGLIHALLVWSGDILFTYAVMGFVMIAAVRLPKKWLLSVALFVYLAPTALLYALFTWIRKTDPNNVLDGYVDIQKIELAISAYAHGTFGEIFIFRMKEWLMFGLSSALLGLLFILPLVMIGAALSKWKVIERAAQLKVPLLISGVVLTAGGLWLKAMPFTDGPKYENLLVMQTNLGGPLVTLGYAALLLLLWQLVNVQKILHPIAKAGRMAFTTYIMQSIIATTIFYSYGLGLYGKVDVATGTWMAIGIFVIQVIFAMLWLSKFRMGPLEFLWRKLSYGKNFNKIEEIK